MNTEVTATVALASELSPDAVDVPAWLEDALLVPREEGWVKSGGCDMHYFRWGNPKNPGLLLIHGFLAHARCFGFIAPFLAQHYHVVAFDLSGMGDSGVREHYSDPVRAAEVEDVARATGLLDHAVKPIVIAHSYGGHVALTAMQEHHALFGGLIICDLMVLRPERLKAYFGSEKPLRSDPSRPNRVYPDYETAKGRFVLSPPQPVNVPSLFDYMAYHSLKQVEGGWTWKFDTGVFQSDFGRQERMFRQGEIIAETPGRKAIVYGQDSLLFDDDSAEYIHECGATDVPIIGIPGARHHLMLDEPIAFVSVLRTILAQWEAQSA
ncbi:MAG: pimeloyl-ACP methyl ester carboxylesterase [Glaciecola sp.]|jgi:pimeloyl-ACP methyl ester carboxylesterase|uniref:alpha/beta fold hydrolase n=1 Tax=Congregibacter sp. TaxID=2744308 RepID=UPI0039E3B912